MLKARWGFYSHRFILSTGWINGSEQRIETCSEHRGSHGAYSTLFPEESQRQSWFKCFSLDRMWFNMKPRDIDFGVCVEVNFEAEIDKVAYLWRGEERKVKG